MLETIRKHQVRKPLTLQDVVRIVSEFSRNDHETAVVVADLLHRGVVRVRSRCPARRGAVR